MLNLPKQCLVNKVIPKKKIHEKISINSSVKDELTKKIEKIIWMYKISEETTSINSTETIKEIQFFEIILKEKYIPKTITSIINKAIPYKIVYMLKYNDEFCYMINDDYLIHSEWNEIINFNFGYINLNLLYESFIKLLLNKEESTINSKDLLQNKIEIEAIQKEIDKYKSKIRKEKQFNKKVELNKILKQLMKEKEKLSNE